MTATQRAPSAQLLASLRLHEGEGGKPVLHAYADPKSHGAPWTIGYGRAGKCGPGATCTPTQAEAWLREDAQTAIDDVLTHLPWTAHLDAARFDVLAEMAEARRLPSDPP